MSRLLPLPIAAILFSLLSSGFVPPLDAQEDPEATAIADGVPVESAVIVAQGAAPEIAVEAVKSEQARPSSAAPGAAEPLQIIGVLTASHLYTTYGYIEITADALTKKVYGAEQVRMLMTEVSAICDNIIDQLGRINRKDLSAEDAAAIAEMISIYRQLRVAAEALKTYAAQPTEKNSADYELARRNVWPRIEKLLGLKSEK